MQQQQPSMPSFSPAGGPSPISSRPPEGQRVADEPPVAGGSSAPASAGSFDHEAAGDEGDRSGSAGNRWPRQETLALLKIRSEMDAAFREAALKGPLWEDVSRKLAAMGYKRSAKKCREKFENVDKYYKRTKDGRAGRGDGKAYRFFSELEALHGGAGASSPAASLAPTPVAMAPPAAFPLVGVGVHAEPPPPHPAIVVTSSMPTAPPAAAAATCVMTPGDVSFLSSSEDGEDTDETGGKRKRRGSGSSSSKMMRFFEGLMRQVMERQEEMQQRFIEAMERREQDRMIREEAWRRQEVARLAREQDALAQERAMAASRDAAVVSFIQRITGQTIPMPPASSSVVSLSLMKPTPVASAAPPPQPPSSIQLLAPKPPPPPPMPMTMTTTQSQSQPQAPAQPSTESKQEVVVRTPAEDTTMAASPSPSRWPKTEVHALIQLRTELEARYQDSGPKGPLWEDISAGMRRMGYNRSAKRCKEKWENINKYFKKVKESNKKRPEDSKTCPYYHQLEALYRSKQALLASSGSGGGGGGASPQNPRPEQAATVTVLAAVPLSQTPPHHHHHHQAVRSAGGNNNKDCNGNGNGCAATRDGGGMQTQQGTNGTNGTATSKEDMMMMSNKKETTPTEEMPQPVSMNDSYVNDRMDAGDSDSMDDDEDDFDDEDEDDVANNSNQMNHQYEIQFQRQQQTQSSVVVCPNATAGAGSGPGPATTTGSFLTMVHH